MENEVKTISEAESHIRSKRYFFNIASNNPSKKYGWHSLEDVNRNHGGFEPYLKKVAESMACDQVVINMRSPNGTSFLNRGFFLVNTKPVEKVAAEINPSTLGSTKVETKTTTSTEPTKPHTMDHTTAVENVGLKTELRFLNQDNERLKESNKKLEQRNEELFNEVSKLTRELATTGAKHDLDYQKKEIELMQKQKNGLGGIVDELKSMPPETLGMIIGMFKPDHPMLKNGTFNKNASRDTSGIEEAKVLDGTKHEDADTQALIKDVYELLIKEKSATVGMIAALTEYFVKHNEHLVLTFKKWFPDEAKDPTPDPSTDDEDEEEDD